nr:DUF309 domain-containing protein [Ardenticatena sp.]
MRNDLQQHLDYIRQRVVPNRRATTAPLSSEYIADIEARPQPPLLIRGMEQLNGGFWYEQHETLEWLWRATDEPVRDVFKGILLTGVGAYHVRRRNLHGALAKWTSALEYLRPYAGTRPYAIEVDALLAQVDGFVQHLQAEASPDWEAIKPMVRGLRVHFQRRAAEPRVTAMLQRLDWAYNESVMAFTRNVRDLSEEEADWHPVEGMRTIRFLIQHIGTGKVVYENCLFGDGSLTWDAVHPPQSIPDLLHWIAETQERLRLAFGFAEDVMLDEERAFFRWTLSVERIGNILAEHDLYHAGEINAIREQWRARRR